MKKITYPIISIVFLIFVNACAGYKPVYTTNLQLNIADHLIKSNKQLGKEIYYKLYNMFKLDQNNPEAQSVTITIDSTKNKDATTKDSSGKILEYRIVLNSNIIIKDYLTDDEILNENFSYSLTYEVQELYSETIKLENKSTKDLINKTYQDLLIKISQTIQKQ